MSAWFQRTFPADESIRRADMLWLREPWRRRGDISRTTVELPGVPYACNPSLSRTTNGWASVVRSVTYKLNRRGHMPYRTLIAGWKTENWYVRLDNRFAVTHAERMADEAFRHQHRELSDGAEDARHFIWRGDEYILVAGHRRVNGASANTMAIMRVKNAQPESCLVLPSPFDLSCEKNWMPLVRDDRLFFVYRFSPLVIYELIADRLERVDCFAADARGERWSGSSPFVRYGQEYLCVLHRRLECGANVVILHCLATLDANLQIGRIGRPFRFEQNGVEFCSGLAIHDQRCVFSYGVSDRKAVFLDMPLREVERLLEVRPSANRAAARASSDAGVSP
jgi:hypothetical protein